MATREEVQMAKEIASRLQPWMIAGTAAQMRGLTDEQLAVTANLPIDGMRPQEMVDRIMAQKEIERRG